MASHLARRGLTELADDAQLIASELVTNALLHAGPPAEVVLRVSPPRARLEVRDRSRVPPVRARRDTDVMTGRGLHLVEGLAHDWGVSLLPSGKAVWAELEVGGQPAAPADRDEHDLIEMWAADVPDARPAPTEDVFLVRLGDVPTDLLLAAKSHVDNLVREFTLAASGADSGASAQLPPHIARMVEGVVNGFADARQSIKRQALAAARAGRSHVALELTLPLTAASAGEEYLRALDQADAYCRAARLLTLESPPQHRVFRRWYVEELIGQLRRAAAGEPVGRTKTFEQRLLDEIGALRAAERRSDRAARLHALAVSLAAADTPEAVSETVLDTGVAALDANGGAILLAGEPALVLTDAGGQDQAVAARLRAEGHDAGLPAAVALRTGTSVWLESRAERDERFPDLAALDPATVSLCAVPLQVGERRLGALRFSFAQARLFDAGDRSFVEAVAAQAAQALDRVRLAGEAAGAARRLRDALLPRRLPEIPGVALSAVQPQEPSSEVGAPFCDVWACAPERWAVALGDVGGGGLHGAAVNALIRHTLRTLAATATDVEAVLRQLDRALAEDTGGDGGPAIVVFGLLTVRAGGCDLDLASGGHPGPILVRAGGRAEAVPLAGSPVGARADAVIDRRRLRLEPGDEVVLAGDAEAVEQAIRAHAGGRPHDDFALLTLRVLPA